MHASAATATALLFALAATTAATAAAEVPIVIMSDRYLGTATVMNSTCSNAADPESLTFHVITSPEGVAVLPALFAGIAPCAGARLTTTTVAGATDQLAALGFHPFWTNPAFDEVAKSTPVQDWAVRTPYTDAKHADALNHLRFYLPHLPMLEGASRFVFMDDDIVLQRDVADFAAFELAPGKAMAAGCQHWKWSPTGFVTSYDTSMAATGYMGDTATPCVEGAEGGASEQKSCTRSTLMAELQDVHDEMQTDRDDEMQAAGAGDSDGSGSSSGARALRGDASAATAATTHPLDHTAFNMGFNVIDVAEWQALRLTERYEMWVAASNDRKLFPPDTLAFGLVIAYLALGEAVQCYDDSVTHLVGLAFIPQSRLEGEYGWTTQRMRDEAFALHFNGSNKPWDAAAPECRAAGEDEFPAAVDIWRAACGSFCPCKPAPSAEAAHAKGAARRRLLSVEDSEGVEDDSEEDEGAATPNEYVPKPPVPLCEEGCAMCASADVCTSCEPGYDLQSGDCVLKESLSPASRARAASGLALTGLIGLCTAAMA